jgi:hypothetical protein
LLPSTRVTTLAASLAELQRTSPDCNRSEMQTELMQFLREIVEADGVVTSREQRALAAVRAVFDHEAAVISRTTKKRLRAAAGSATITVSKAAAATRSAAAETMSTTVSTIKDRIDALDQRLRAFRRTD